MAQQQQLQLPKGLIGIIAIVIVGLIIITKSAVTIDSGQAGVLYKTFGGGVVTDQPAMGEGFHIVAPWNKVYVYEVRQQELTERMKVLSSNGLDIQLEASVWFKPQAANLGKLHQEKGANYLDRVLKPAMRSATRSVVGRYTPEQIYSSKRDAIQAESYDETKLIVEDQYIELVEVLVRDVTYHRQLKMLLSVN